MDIRRKVIITMKNNEIHTYDDIIDLPHPISRTHPQMSQLNRAAQFAPFAALTGYNEAIKETQRLTDERRVLDENQKVFLNDALLLIMEHIAQRPLIHVTYFKEDKKKDGGAYYSITKRIKRVDECNRLLIFEDYFKLYIEDIYEIDMIREDEIYL